MKYFPKIVKFTIATKNMSFCGRSVKYIQFCVNVKTKLQLIKHMDYPCILIKKPLLATTRIKVVVSTEIT